MFSFLLLHKANEDGKEPVPVYIRWSNLTHVIIFKVFVLIIACPIKWNEVENGSIK